MNAKDQYKIVKVGFMIIRADEQNLRVKAKTEERPEWHYIGEALKSKAELRRQINKLLELEKVVED